MGAGHYHFNYKFSDTEGINFGSQDISLFGDLLIYYGSRTGQSFIDCWCTRWDQSNWNITVETFLDKSDLNTLLDNTLPGAVGELWEVLGSIVHYDQSWEGLNTIKFTPHPYTTFTPNTGNFSGTNKSDLSDMRNETIVYVKNITTSPVEGDSGIINVKIEAVKSGGTI